MSAKKSKATKDSDSPLVADGGLNEESPVINWGDSQGMTTHMMNHGMPLAYVANNDALDGLEKLDALAKGGNKDAIRMFHSITCGMVERLNALHLEYAAAVLEWPVLLPQDRKDRNAVTKRANEMRIGSVPAGGLRRPDELGYESDKGFAIGNLRRLSFARAILKMVRYRRRRRTGSAVLLHSQSAQAILPGGGECTVTDIFCLPLHLSHPFVYSAGTIHLP